MNNHTGKDIQSRDHINHRMQNFYVKSNKDQNGNLDSDYFNYKNSNSKVEYNTIQKTDFKNDINERLSQFNDMSIDNMRRLPLNNNIRDYQITVDSKRDQFNERMSNYSLLSSNMVAPLNTSSEQNNIGFHTNFKEDHNKRLQELSPLSRNMGLPVNKEVPNKKEVMEKIKTGDYGSFNVDYYSGNSNNYEFLDEVQEIQVSNFKPIDTRQNFNFNN